MYSTGPDIGFVALAFVFGGLNLWATIIVIVAGHRYIDRTSPRFNKKRGETRPGQG